MSRWYYYASAFFVLQGIQPFAVVDRVLYGEWLGKGGDKLTQSLNLLVIITSLALFARGWRRIRSLRTGAILAIGLALFLLCSAVWSRDPHVTVREAILYSIVMVGAIGVATNLTGDEYMELLARICSTAGLISLLLFVVSPGIVHGDEGADFRGIFSQKNVLGEAMTMGALANLHGLRAGRGRRWWNATSLALVTVVALMSKSATACLTIFAFCGTDAVIIPIRKGGPARLFGIGIVALALPVVVFAAAFPETVLEMIGKDPTLTGRTEIWGYVIADIYQRPWLGWGYLAFWSYDNPAAMEISNALHWVVPQSHNGLLEMLLYVGVIGAAFFIFVWTRTVWLSLRCMRTAQQALATSCLLSCMGIILVGISETVLIDPFEASTGVFFIIGLLCERAVRVARLRRYPMARWGNVHAASVRT